MRRDFDEFEHSHGEQGSILRFSGNGIAGPLDTEMTGLGNRAEVVEAAVLDTTGAVRYETLRLPVGRIPWAVSDIHELTRAKLTAAGARPWPGVHGELAEALDRSSPGFESGFRV